MGTTQLTEINALLLKSAAMPVAKEIISPDVAGQKHSLDQLQLSQTSRRRGYTHRINKVETEKSPQSTDLLYCEKYDIASEQEEIFVNLTASHCGHVVKNCLLF